MWVWPSRRCAPGPVRTSRCAGCAPSPRRHGPLWRLWRGRTRRSACTCGGRGPSRSPGTPPAGRRRCPSPSRRPPGSATGTYWTAASCGNESAVCGTPRRPLRWPGCSGTRCSTHCRWPAALWTGRAPTRTRPCRYSGTPPPPVSPSGCWVIRAVWSMPTPSLSRRPWRTWGIVPPRRSPAPGSSPGRPCWRLPSPPNGQRCCTWRHDAPAGPTWPAGWPGTQPRRPGPLDGPTPVPGTLAPGSGRDR